MLKKTLISLAASLPLAAGLITLTVPAAHAETLADRNAYISYVAPSTEVGQTLRVKLLGYGFRACEGITADVPTVTLVQGLMAQYHLTSTEAWRVKNGADKFLC